MRAFGAAILAQLTGEIARMFLLVSIQRGYGQARPVLFGDDPVLFGTDELVFGGGNVTSALRYTDCDIDLVVDGNRYSAFPFEVGDLQQTTDLSVASVELRFSSVDQSLVQAVLSEDVRGYVAILSLICLDADYQSLGAEELFRGYIDEWRLDEQEVRLTVLNELFMWSKKTLRKCQASCRWEFKGAECAYAGSETWCDRSWERCVELGNSPQFGGFRFMPAIMEKDIWWGRIPLV